MPIDRPILFIGATRSGKSMLADLLGELDGFHTAFEPLGCWNYGFRDAGSDVRTREEANEQVCQHIRSQIKKTLSANNASRYVDDLPHHALRIGFCHAVLPDARFVMVARDGIETIQDMKYGWEHKDTLAKVLARRLGGGHHKTLNLKKLPGQGIRWFNNAIRRRLGARRTTWGPTAPGQIEFAKEHTLIETIAYQWQSFVAHALDGLDQIPQAQVLHVRYEQILADPEGQTRRLGEFCQVDPPQNLVDIAQRTIDKDRKPYSQALSPAELELVEPIISVVQSRLGYTR